MRGIFISYRRDDSEGYVGRLYQDLVERFGRGAVFMDVAAIKAGRDFRRVIDEQVSACGVLLVVIGRNWLEARDEAGQLRLEMPADPVRLEVAAALRRRDLPVVPVLVHGARIPPSEKLPVELADLAYRNAAELTHPRWTSDVQLLIKGLESDLGLTSDPTFGFAHKIPVPRKDVAEHAPAAAPMPGKEQAAGGPAIALTKPPDMQVSDARSVVTQLRWPLTAALLVALSVAGGGGYWYHVDAAAKKAEVDRVAVERKAEQDRIALQKAKEEEAARAEAARVEAERFAAQKAAADAALEQAQLDAAQAKVEAADANAARGEAEASAQRAAADAKATAQRSAAKTASKVAQARQAAPAAAGASLLLTPWLSVKDFGALQKRQRGGQDFPYSFQVMCTQFESGVRGRFGPFPQGVARFYYGVNTADSYTQQNSALLSRGYRLYSRQAVTCNVKAASPVIVVAAVWVQVR